MRDPLKTLNRLTIGKPCSASWSAMTGGGAQRHCAECDRTVHDLAQRTPHEVERLIAVENGRLCGRLTRDAAGRLVTRLPVLPSSKEVTLPAPRRFAPLAAALVAGLVGVPAAATSPAPVAPQSAGETPATAPAGRSEATGGASLFGRVWGEKAGAAVLIRAKNTLDGSEFVTTPAADGGFVLLGLPSGIYTVTQEHPEGAWAAQDDILLHAGERRAVELSQDSFTIVIGDVSAPPFSLRAAFEASELVIAGLVGKTTQLDSDDTWNLRSELYVTAHLKGEALSEVVSVDHYGSEESFAQGSEVLAFLTRDEAGGWTLAWGAQLEVRSRVWIADHEERLAALAGLDPGDSGYAAELLDWLVTTTAQTETRASAVHDLVEVVDSLESLVERRGTSLEFTLEDLRGVVARFEREGGRLGAQPPLGWLATFLEGSHRNRLTKALAETLVLRAEDLALYHLVVRWNREAALDWLGGRLRSRIEADQWLVEQAVRSFAADSGDPALGDFVATLDEAEGEALAELLATLRQSLGQ
ncbi:MAG: carboxypeptidase-like regulatory domain-containing protein [Thermoanaerobaculia bacterium]|nr:carboxypeptidase-like regulatory domain-containing protein [Thermoanaerobaculia bacterium]